jgi:integrase
VARINLRFVQAFSAPSGQRYYYFRKPGCERIRLPGFPGSTEFNEAYAAALTTSAPRSDVGADRNAPGTIAALVALYAETADFKHAIAPETRRTMWAILQRFRNDHGTKRVAPLKREHVLAILAARPPFAQRNWVRALRPLLAFAVSIRWIAENPVTDIKVKLPRKSEGFRAWGEDQVEAFRRHHAIGTKARLAFELLLNTMQRRGDVIRMGPQHIRNELLHVRQQKTGAQLQLPIFPELQEAMDALPATHLTFLSTEWGKPFTAAGFGNWFRDRCDEADLKGFSAHGLRKAGMARFAQAGCSVHQIAAWSGHKTLHEIAHYTRSVEQAALAQEAMDMMIPRNKTRLKRLKTVKS